MGSTKRNADTVIAAIRAMNDVGVIDDGTRRAAVRYVDGHEAEVEEMLASEAGIDDIADRMVDLSRSHGGANPVPYEPTSSKENDMAAKKGKGKKAKGKGKAKRAAVQTGGEARPRVTIANFIREKLEKAGKDYDAKKIAEQAAAEFPGKKPTAGYVNWIKEHASKVSTTTTVAA